MTTAVLDTSIIIDLLRGHEPARIWFDGLGSSRFAITPIVWMETIQGAANKIKLGQAIRFLRQFHLEHTEPADDTWAMRQLASFYLSHGLHLEDAMIASVAVRLSVPIFTTNLKHYEPLPGVEARRPYIR